MSVRMSTQARAVLSILEQTRCHLTAEEILVRADSIGTATVYRALEHLTDMGLVRRLSVGRKSSVYEYVREPHMHFVCRRPKYDTTQQESVSTTQSFAPQIPVRANVFLL